MREGKIKDNTRGRLEDLSGVVVLETRKLVYLETGFEREKERIYGRSQELYLSNVDGKHGEHGNMSVCCLHIEKDSLRWKNLT